MTQQAAKEQGGLAPFPQEALPLSALLTPGIVSTLPAGGMKA